MPGRAAPPQDPVSLTLDGARVVAQRGEPVAASLVGAGLLSLARSPKFHRPRGPACLRGGCDGCLARVDGVPNVMTCLVPATEGMQIRSQNTLGSRDVDLLRVTDWFFPDGMNHHELFAGVPGVQTLMQTFARRVAGLGRLPKEVREPRPAVRRSVDVLVIGAGAAGMAVALAARDRGRQVEIVEESFVPGGSLLALSGADQTPWSSLLSRFRDGVASGALRLRGRTTAGGVFGDDVLLAGGEGAEVITARDVIFATGAHDGALAFEGNDVPGVLSARAAGLLASRGIWVGARVVVVAAPGAGTFGEAFVRAFEALPGAKGRTVTLRQGEVRAVVGSSRVKGVHVRSAQGDENLPADALVLDAPRAPAYELAAQAGARLVHGPTGYVVTTEGPGALRPGFWAVGEVIGAPLEPASVETAARALASAL